MAAAHIKTPGRTIPAPVLRVRSQLGGVAVRAVRAVRGVRALVGARRAAPSGYAAFTGHASAFGAQVSANVSVEFWLIGFVPNY